MTILLNSAKLSFNSSELLLKPVLVFAIPKSNGDVQLCDNIIFSRHSVLKVEYKSGASFTGIASTLVLLSALLLKATINFSP